MRKEHDFLGELEISDDVYYGVQTLRGVENFKISGQKIGEFEEFVIALAQVKKACALANGELGLVSKEKVDAICKAADKLIAGQYRDQFVVDMIQGGAGTSTNMNANEVITNLALEIMGHKKGEYKFLHPNDDVNLSQSTNDAYPCSLHVAIDRFLDKVLGGMEVLTKSLNKKAEEFKDVIKMGRTQLQDAVPMTLGQEFLAFSHMIAGEVDRIKDAQKIIYEINLGATAIGTGINSHPDYARIVAQKLRDVTGKPYFTAKDLIEATPDTSAYVYVSGAFKRLALKIIKICNDLRLLGSGPRCMLNEINLPKMQPGSSIMPGKVNPVIPEVANQVCYAVLGNDVTVSFAAENGQLQLNVMEPVIAYALFNSANMLNNAMRTLATLCVDNITANKDVCLNFVKNSIGIVTALNPYIGYEESASIAKEALATGKSVYDIALSRNLLEKSLLDKIFEPKNMLNPHMDSSAIAHQKK